MAASVHVGRSRREVAQTLVEEHRKNDPDLQAVYFADDPGDREIRLVEISGSVGETGQVLPFRFAARPDLGVPYPCVIVLLSPKEWAALQVPASELALPDRWSTKPDRLERLL